MIKVLSKILVSFVILFNLSGVVCAQTDETAVAVTEEAVEEMTGTEVMPEKPMSFAVVELYTSEGCSSCPPADNLARALSEESRAKGKPIYILGFHVDYWNYLGWTDSFSTLDYTKRQRKYSKQFNESQVYTPQIIINGQSGFPGYNKEKLEAAVEDALSTPAQVDINLEIYPNPHNKKDRILVYRLSDIPENALLRIALIERNLSNKIGGGENQGKTLLHANVVRQFKAFKMDQKEASIILNVPSSVKIKNASVVVFIQNEDTLEIIGANEIDLLIPDPEDLVYGGQKNHNMIYF